MALGKELAEHRAGMAALEWSIQPLKRSPAARALVELEAPLVSRKQNSPEMDGSSSGGGGGSPSYAATVSSSRAAAYALRSNASSSPSAPKKTRAATNAPQQQVSWLAQLFIEHPDPATAIADFLDAESALGGIGAAARALRVAVKAAMPRLGIKKGDDKAAKPKLEEFGRLLHLAVDPYIFDTDWVQTVLTHGLSARLHSLRGMYHSVVTKCGRGWEQLRSLDVSSFGMFLSRAERHPNVVFPRLSSLALSALTGAGARGLLAALDRGASRPSLHCHRHRQSRGCGRRTCGTCASRLVSGGFGVHMRPTASAA